MQDAELALRTLSGKYVVYRRGSGERRWHFRPSHHDSRDVYSEGYATAIAALEAAEAWERQRSGAA